MSATIPSNKLLKDLLKPTGFDCPEELQGKTFAEATSGGGGGDMKYHLYAWKHDENIVYTEKKTPQVHDLALTTGGEFLEVLTIFSATSINVHGTDYTRDAESDLEESVSSFESIPTVTQNGALFSADGKAFKAVNVNVPIGGVDKLFCWKKENEDHYAYTISENPKVNDKAIIGDNDLSTDTVWELLPNGINLDMEGQYYRHPAKDVAL